MKNNLKRIRFDKNLSQEKLAKMSGVSRVTIAQIENEKVIPDGMTIAKLVSALNVPANKIFFALDVVCTQQG